MAFLRIFFLAAAAILTEYSSCAYNLNPPPVVLKGAAATAPSSSSSSSASSSGTTVAAAITGRRAALGQVAVGIATAAATVCSFGIESARASGGATAGRYTTIPIAKRRYYGRVQQGVHEFLLMGTNGGGMVQGDMTAYDIQHFFDVEGTVIVPAKRKDVNGVCTKKDGDCKGKEIRDSRWNDMKASMYLLANAFRTDQQKPPDRLPTVKAAKAFFKEVDAIQKNCKKKKKDDPETAALYLSALDLLDQYLDLVELPPIDSGHYDKEFDTLVGETARIT